jgi:hypothetical protein
MTELIMRPGAQLWWVPIPACGDPAHGTCVYNAKTDTWTCPGDVGNGARGCPYTLPNSKAEWQYVGYTDKPVLLHIEEP